MMKSLRQDWLSNVRNDLLAGIVVALALIPEAIAFSIIAGVDPKVGLYASFSIAAIIAFAGGRPGMVSGATGAMALLMVTLVKDHGLQYLLAATVLTGVLQILAGWLKLGALMRFVSRSVITGFVNALAILIFSAQLPQLRGAGVATWAMLGFGLALIYGLPRLRALTGWQALTAIPSPLICVVLVSVLNATLGLQLPTVADLGQLPDALPLFGLPQVPLSLETLQIIALPALAIAMVGLLESVLTASVIDELTDTPSNKNRECSGLGLANIASSCFGGIAGCGMVGQAVGNVKFGGRGRLSTLFAGVFLLVLMVALKPWVSQVPVVALVAIMFMVSAETFDWKSLGTLVRHPRLSSAVMLATVVVTIASHNLAAGVAVGVVLSGVFFAVKVSHLLDVRCSDDEAAGTRTWTVTGQVFFASADAFIEAFDVRSAEHLRVTIDVSRAHFWDITAVAALDKVVQRLRHHGCEVEVAGLNEASAVLIDRMDTGAV